jgi:hypothetical protein
MRGSVNARLAPDRIITFKHRKVTCRSGRREIIRKKFNAEIILIILVAEWSCGVTFCDRITFSPYTSCQWMASEYEGEEKQLKANKWL